MILLIGCTAGCRATEDQNPNTCSCSCKPVFIFLSLSLSPIWFLYLIHIHIILFNFVFGSILLWCAFFLFLEGVGGGVGGVALKLCIIWFDAEEESNLFSSACG